LLFPDALHVFLSIKVNAGNFSYSYTGSYQGGAANMLLHNNSTFVTADSLNNYSYNAKGEGIYGSMGQGFNYGMAFAYQANPTLGFELAYNYLQSSPYETRLFYMRTFYGGDWYSNLIKTQVSGSVMSLNPSAKICTKAGKAVTYFKLGLVLALCSRQNDIQYDHDSKKYGLYQHREKEVYDNAYTIGTQSALGISYPVSEMFSIGAEFNMTNLTTSFLASKLVSYTINGRDYLSVVPVQWKKTEYVENFDSKNASPNEPMKQLLEPTPFSSYGFGISLIFKINPLPDMP
jgi:hypothetical protein